MTSVRSGHAHRCLVRPHLSARVVLTVRVGVCVPQHGRSCRASYQGYSTDPQLPRFKSSVLPSLGPVCPRKACTLLDWSSRTDPGQRHDQRELWHALNLQVHVISFTSAQERRDLALRCGRHLLCPQRSTNWLPTLAGFGFEAATNRFRTPCSFTLDTRLGSHNGNSNTR